MAPSTSPKVIPPSPPIFTPLAPLRPPPPPPPFHYSSISPFPLPPSHIPSSRIPTKETPKLTFTQANTAFTPILTTSPPTTSAQRKPGQHSSIAKSVMTAPAMSRTLSAGHPPTSTSFLAPPCKGDCGAANKNGSVGSALTDTPATTAPNSPRIRATTLDIPGLTKSKISPDGRIASRDIGAKLVIVMVGLPARGKSYVTKKIARYLNWLQHDTKIFNVGNRRRVAAGMETSKETPNPSPPQRPANGTGLLSSSTLASLLETTMKGAEKPTTKDHDPKPHIEQTAEFFDPQNVAAKELREKVAMETLDELLHYILFEGGSVGILDATNSSLERRKAIVDRIRKVAGTQLGIVFLESECHDQKLLEANMRLKLSGPDYKGQDPEVALADFKKRVALYETSYIPVGEYEEKHGLQYIKMVDVGRKVVAHQIKGFLAGQTVYYLLNFNLAPRQIWITRHGESEDNILGQIGGDAPLSLAGQKYAKALAKFTDEQRNLFHARLQRKHAATLLPYRPGDTTPPNPEYSTCSCDGEDDGPMPKNFCVWTSMLKRSIQTAQYFDEEQFDIKEMRMLNELNAGICEGMTYKEILEKYPEEYTARRKDKLHYRYPGPGGESYLDVINRLRAVIVEVERMTDHVLLIGHRVVARVLLAYFLGLKRDDVADLDVPLGILYCLEPKPYGVGFKAYRYNPKTEWFDHMPGYEIQSEKAHR